MIQSRRLMYSLTKNSNTNYNIVNKNRFYSPSVSRFSSEEESIHSAESQSIPPPPPPPPTSSSAAKKKSPFVSLLKFGIFSAFLGTTATAGYATYTYTTEQVDELTKEFRQSAYKRTVEDDASSVEKYKTLLYSAAMTVPAKCIEIYLDLRRSIEEKVQEFADPSSDKLLPDMIPQEQMMGAKTIVLDLNETLIYSNWTRERGWRTFKRPGVDLFLFRLSQCCEVVIYTDQMDTFVQPIIERLNQVSGGAIRYFLSRSATKYQDGKHYRDLSKLNRDPSRVIYISAHALENALQPENCAQIKPWKLEEDDTTLVDLLPFLEFVARQGPASPDMRQVLASFKGCDIATEFAKRQREMQEKKKQKPARFFGRLN
ncbi:mitochondrial import inner membrane translocase subunit TIM50-like [Thalictrum thalictroides]|uniref:Mitochondrial import inner membrane translocase subunit TIM50 n=1 Tax=Thalictrum thalictroides TaxID=46969 RepID=A0A7J6WGZ5_THATH|nr:mitochondrial import inner membrane translocase subunit TIM50-like [Thalictrum thalictroides]